MKTVKESTTEELNAALDNARFWAKPYSKTVLDPTFSRSAEANWNNNARHYRNLVSSIEAELELRGAL